MQVVIYHFYNYFMFYGTVDLKIFSSVPNHTSPLKAESFLPMVAEEEVIGEV